MIGKTVIKWHTPVDSNPDQQWKKISSFLFVEKDVENLFYTCFYFYKLFPVIFIYTI